MKPAGQMTLTPQLENFVREEARRGAFASGSEHVRVMLRAATARKKTGQPSSSHWTKRSPTALPMPMPAASCRWSLRSNGSARSWDLLSEAPLNKVVITEAAFSDMLNIGWPIMFCVGRRNISAY
jgi:hypothetical protein